MFRMIIITLVFSLFVCGCDTSDDASLTPQQPTADIEAKILGIWILDIPRSIEKVKTSPKAQTSDPEFIASNVEKMAAKLKMNITDAEMTMTIGTREQTLGYTITSVDEKVPSVTASCNDVPDVTIVFTIIEDDYLNVVSSGTDDTNYYIWKHAD